jgi:perosamine synthetase
MLDVEAAVGREQLRKYPQIIQRRRNNAEWYDTYLRRREGWCLPPIRQGATYSHYVVRVPNRKQVVREHSEKGWHLGELIQYSLPSLTNYRGCAAYCPNADLASMHTINFPISGTERTTKTYHL